MDVHTDAPNLHGNQIESDTFHLEDGIVIVVLHLAFSASRAVNSEPTLMGRGRMLGPRWEAGSLELCPFVKVEWSGSGNVFTRRTVAVRFHESRAVVEVCQAGGRGSVALIDGQDNKTRRGMAVFFGGVLD